MSLGHLPLLTRGTFALLYGGENIIDKLEVRAPGWVRISIISLQVISSDNGVYTLILASTLFQLCLYLIKKYR